MLAYNFDDYLKLEEVKRQLRVSFNVDDEDIKDKAEIALAAVAQYLNRNIYPITETIPDSDLEYGIHFNKPIKGGVMLFVTDLYYNRTISLEQSVNKNDAFNLLLDPFRNFAIGGA